VGFAFVVDPLDWTTTLSHAVLELLIDPWAALFVPGPDPRDATRTVLHSYDIFDPVETLAYEVNGVLVSDFVTPAYFNLGSIDEVRNDYLDAGVTRFAPVTDSHIAFVDPSNK